MKKELKLWLEQNPYSLALLDAGEYELLFNTIPCEYVGTLLNILRELDLTKCTTFTVWQSGNKNVKTKLLDEEDYKQSVDWAIRNVGVNTYWYITNDESGEIILYVIPSIEWASLVAQ